MKNEETKFGVKPIKNEETTFGDRRKSQFAAAN